MTMRLSHPMLRFALLLALVLSVSLPTTALAAPSLQGSLTSPDEALLIAQYQADVLSSEGDEGAVASLFFYDDNSVELMLEIPDEEEPTVANGDWEEMDEGILVRFTSVDGEDLDEVVEVEMLFDEDDALIVYGSPDGPLGEDDVVFHPVEIGEASRDVMDTAVDLTGVYVSGVEPNDITDGVVYLINLLPDGQASVNSDYLDMEPPIFESGSWEDNGDATVTLEILGTAEQDYDEPIVITFEVGAYGELTLDDLSLYPLAWLGAHVEAMTAGMEEPDETDTGMEGDVRTYVAEFLPPGEQESLVVYMLLYDDGTVLMFDEDQVDTLFGEWVQEDDTLSVTLTTDGDTDFEDPGVLVFTMGADGSLVGVEYPVEVFGEDELVFYPADEGADAGGVEGEISVYESDVLPIEGNEGVITLILTEAGDAYMTYESTDGEETTVEYGEWERDRRDNVVVTITEGEDEVYDEPYVFTFVEDEDDQSLTLRRESVEVFGDVELVLDRVE